MTFELKDRAGNSLLKQTDGEYDWDLEADFKAGIKHAPAIPEPGDRSEDDWLQVGRSWSLNGKTVLALTTYEAGLEKYPRSQSLQVAAGRQAASLQRFKDAERWLQQAQMRDTSNSEIAYYLGIAEQGLGHMREAQTSYDVAYRQATLRGPAALKSAELRGQQGDLQGAAIFLKTAVAAEPANLLCTGRTGSSIACAWGKRGSG